MNLLMISLLREIDKGIWGSGRPESNQIIFLYSQGRSSYTPQDSFHELVSRSIKIQIGMPACVMSSDYFTSFSLYLARLNR